MLLQQILILLRYWGATSPAIQGDQAKSQLQITSSGVLSFDIAPDYDLQVPDLYWGQNLMLLIIQNSWRIGSLSGYKTGATMDFMQATDFW